MYMWLPWTACMVSQLWFLYGFWEQYCSESLLDLSSSSSLCTHYASCDFDTLFCNFSVISSHDSLKIGSSLRLETLSFIFIFLYLWPMLPFPNIFSSISPQHVRAHTHRHTLYLVCRKWPLRISLLIKNFGKTNEQLFFALNGLNILFLKVMVKMGL